jgi:uncharacterized beta-barrel protein YwiB (DUF1934 family)
MPESKKRAAKDIPILMNITDRHIQEDEEDSAEIFCQGRLHHLPKSAGGGIEIRYLEEAHDLRGSLVRLTVRDGTVNIFRAGDFPLDFMLQKGQRHKCYFRTPFGETQMGVYAREVELHLDEAEEQSIRLVYTLDAEGDLLSENEMFIKLRKREQNTSLPL